MRASLNTLVRALEHSQGEFSLILVRCNNLVLRKQIIDSVRSLCAFEIQEIVLEPFAKTLYTTILNEFGSNYPQALMVLGFESVTAINELLKASNLVREKFREFPFPVVLWINSAVLEKLIRQVPDFKNWASISIKFDETADNDPDFPI